MPCRTGTIFREAIGDCTDIVDTIFGLTDTIVPSVEEFTKAVEDIFLNVATTLDSVRKLNNDALVLRDAVESTKAALDDTLHAMRPAPRALSHPLRRRRRSSTASRPTRTTSPRLSTCWAAVRRSTASTSRR